MTINEQAVAKHYGTGGLLKRIFGALEADGVDLDHLKPGDLKALEDFHIGGREATVYATQRMDLSATSQLLDIGCAIGGAARYLANEHGCKITGIDLTPEYIEVGHELNERLGLADKINLKVASALDLPFEDQSFDYALTMHVAMNIKDRAGMYSEAARVLKPRSIFLIYDIMKMGDEPVLYPVPWAATSETSHLVNAGDMQILLADAGFEVLEVEDRTPFALDVFAKGRALAAKATKPAPPHAIMGASAPSKMKNIRENIETGRVAPTLMIARRAA